ncbi:MAG: glycosyltransferase [Alphaproteobacteria bacterium]|nr:glycosyltransferase [Alphaproteobacteria bacterium]
MIRVFIGYDPREAVAFSVLAHSIHRRASRPVSVTPLMLSQLGAEMTRERHPLQSSEFSFSRFIVPALCNYEGWALFMDGDMIMLDDVAKLWALADPAYAVMVVQHDHRPREDMKKLGAVQTSYERKNWSSVMLFNCARCRALTPDYVNTASGLDLHRFNWLKEGEIGALPARWNHLVGYDPGEPAENLSVLHYTLGGPYYEGFENSLYADEWRAENAAMNAVAKR